MALSTKMSIEDAKAGGRPRVRRSAEAARENILAAAEALLTEKGPQALKLADVANAAGVVHATVLHHFGSIADVQAALAERMIRRLVEQILDTPPPETGPAWRSLSGVDALFDAFEAPGAARLAAWLQLTDEMDRLTVVGEAVQSVVRGRMVREGLDEATARDLVLLSVILALGAGLFGPSLAALTGAAPGRPRELVMELLRSRITALGGGL